LISIPQDVASDSLSPIIIGTMGFHDKGLSTFQVLDLVQNAIELGVDTFHVSHEYTSYKLMCSVLNNLTNSTKYRFKSIAKISAPHFDEINFSKRVFEKKIDSYLKETSLEKINLVQWMWRQNPLDDESRIQKTQNQANEVIESFRSLQKSGKVEDFACFPYSSAYMESVRQLGISSCQINYLNFWESALVDGGVGINSIAIRPFGAGKISSLNADYLEKLNIITDLDLDNLAAHCIRFPLSHPNISSVIVGINSKKNLESILRALNLVDKDLVLFNKYLSVVGESGR